jgi:acyl-CoA reductase-like NAD-dependent aldehyde dehydrogenase
MKKNVIQKSEKEKNLEAINSLDEYISESRKSNKIVAFIMVLAVAILGVAMLAGFNSPFIFPIIFSLLAGNQIYTLLIVKKQKKLNEMKETYTSQFGAIVSPK